MHCRRRAGAFLLSLGLTVRVAYPVPPVPADGGQVQSETTPAILRLRVLEGEGAIHTAGTRSNQPLVVQLTDEVGRPVEGASVSVRLPDEMPTGSFASGMRTEIAVTGPDGRVAIRGISWARAAGPVQIRITASKGEVRAGTFSTQYITEPAGTTARRGTDAGAVPSRAPAQIEQPSRSKWLLLAALIGGAAAGGVAAASRAGRASPAAPPPVAPPATVQPTTIGAPSITVGRP